MLSDHNLTQLVNVPTHKMLSDHNLTQLVNVPTHKRDHILDWVVVRTENSCFCFDSVQDYPDL